jgi:dihydropteroate synthase
MGILNATPDSFSDGGAHLAPAAAAARAREMAAEGADLIDLGGESTRPGAEPVPVDEELRRVLPALEAVRAAVALPISVDTSKAAVAREALRRGAAIVNDVTALRSDPEMARVVADAGAAVVLMHLRGTPRDMQRDPRYDDLLGEVAAFLRDAVARAQRAGIAAERIVVDPGLGFGKTAAHNWELIARLEELRALGRPILVGASRKTFLGALAGAPPAGRLVASAAAAALLAARGAHVIRAHDVAAALEAARAGAAVRAAGRS